MSVVDEPPRTIVVCGGVLLQLAMVYALWAWGRWVARRHEERPFWRWMSHAPWIAFVLQALGVVVTVALLLRAFQAIGSVNAAERASVLADGISTAMNASLCLMLPAYTLYAIALVSFLAGTFK